MYDYNNATQGRESGIALIMVILTLVLMVSIAVSFLNIVGRQKGTAVNVALQTYSDIALQQAQAHTIRTFVESIEETRNNGGVSVEYTTARNAPWRRDFYPLIDADADPWTADDRTSAPPNGWTLDPSTTATSAHPLINTDRDLLDMTGYSVGGYGHKRIYSGPTRWYNHNWLTSELESITIDASLTEAEKVKLRKSARYVIRYTAQVLDVNGCLSINNNYPDFLSDGTSINRGSGSVDNLHYIRQQNYLRTYGRSIKSMASSVYMFSNWGGSRQVRTQGRRDPNYKTADPLDRETVSYNEDGKSHSKEAYGQLERDERLRYERGFRGGDLQFMSGNSLVTGHKGRVYTWVHMSALFMTPNLPIHFSPYADSMRDADLADPGATVPVREVSTPWRVNLLSAPNYVLRAMINGLSSESRISRTKFCNTDMFGLGYPEPFPLDFDAGRNHPLFRIDKPFKGGVMQGGNGNNIYFNSYVLDVVTAVSHAITQARSAWLDEKPIDADHSDGNTYIQLGETTNVDGKMLEQLLRECYRILGEHAVNVGAGSFLSGDKVIVGHGGDGAKFINDYYHPNGDTALGEAQLHPGDNSRAMEYFLNDFMISLFGKAQPDPSVFRVGDAISNDAIAVDFNGDGTAESTVTGWRDSSTGNRVWSWWWDGLGPYVKVDKVNDYMKRPGWYRFYSGDETPYRKVGSKWEPVPDVDTFYEYNDLWLKRGTTYPIKPFSKTGRLFIGKSRILYGFIRSEAYDILSQRVAAASNRNFAYHIDPNEDGDYSDNTLLIQSEIELNNEE